MALSDHALDDVGPLSGSVNSSLSDVDTGNEEGGLETVFVKLV